MWKPRFGIGGRGLLAAVALALLAVILFAAQDSGPNFSPWSQAVAVGPPITSTGNYEACPFISKNGLDLYFRTLVLVPGTTNTWKYDIFVSHRDTVEDPWEDPINLGPNINTDNGSELCSFVTIDGHWIYFVSNRTDLGSFGGNDLWVSHRKDKRDDTGWEPPINLGPGVNSSSGEVGPSIFEDEAIGQVVLYFTRGVGTPSRNKIFSCIMLDQITPGPSTPVAELNSSSAWNDLHTFVRRKDGLEVIFASDRGGTVGLYDLWVSTRATTLDPWSPPEKLGPEVNSNRSEDRPSISWDGTTLYFWTDREWIPYSTGGGYWNIDVYQTTRTKLTGKNK